MSSQANIPLTTEQCNVLRRCRSSFCKAVETKFNCTAILNNLEDSFGSNASKISGSGLRYYTKLSNGLKVSVWKDDLTHYKVDAVVNAANENLNHGGGLALALSNAGGPMFQEYSNQIIKKMGIVPTGMAVVTPPGNLPCKSIIHAVGPFLPASPTQKEVDQSTPLLHNAIRSILDIVEIEKFSSVAIPALSSGLFHFPRNLCADIIVNVIKNYNDYNAFSGRTVEIHLVNNDDPTVQEMERACVQFLGPPTITGSYSGAVKVTNQSMTFSSSHSLQLDNITLHLKKGLIEEEKVDVIVNTISESLDLSMGVISKAILNKAGRKIQEEINKNKYKNVRSGDIFATKGQKLKCAEILHTVCTSRTGSGDLKILYKVVFECLRKAADAHKSISFPAIGTGNIGLLKHDVAKVMMGSVAEFAKQNPAKRLEVNFVVFPADNEMMKTFENELNSMKDRMKSSESLNAVTKSSAFSTKRPTTTETPTLEIGSGTTEAVREAQGWTMNMLCPKNGTITIANNHVMHLGQKEHEILLSLQTMFDVHLKVFFRRGNGGISITGEAASVSCVAIEVESLLCQAQETFALDEETDLLYSVVRWHLENELLPPKISAALEKAYLAKNEDIALHDYNIRANFKFKYLIDVFGKTRSLKRTCLSINYDPFLKFSNSFYSRTQERLDKKDFMEMERKVKACGLSIIRAEKIENAALLQIFELNRSRVKDRPQNLYQCVSAQFCDLICRIGFQKDFAPPAEQKYGDGIYFSSTPDVALKLWNGLKDEYIYIVQAQVLTGKHAIGSPGLIVPPCLGSNPFDRYNSLSDFHQTHVIFNGQQALPEFLFICQKTSFV